MTEDDRKGMEERAARGDAEAIAALAADCRADLIHPPSSRRRVGAIPLTSRTSSNHR